MGEKMGSLGEEWGSLGEEWGSLGELNFDFLTRIWFT
jgi:hypothetical protein